MTAFCQQDSCLWMRDFEKKNRLTFYCGTFSRSIEVNPRRSNTMGKSVSLSPNSFAFAGITAQYKKLFLYLETALPNTHKVSPNQTDVKGYAIFIGHFKKKWGATFFASYNSGLLMATNGSRPYLDRKDINRFSIGFHHYTIFNGDKFSYQSANSGGNQQLQSAGSFMLLTTPSYVNIQSKGSIIPSEILQYHFTGTNMPLQSLQLLSLQVKPGYIYNFIWQEGRCFFSPAVYAGIGTDYHKLKNKSENLRGLNMNVGYRIKTVAGINNDHWYITAEWLMESSRSFLYDSHLNNTYKEASFNIGWRF